MSLNEFLTTIRTELLSAGRVLAAISMAAMLPGIVRADCMPTVPNGWTIDFKMSSHSNNGVVSYTTGQLRSSISGFSSQLSGDPYDSLLNDRRYTWYPWPPFDYTQPDKVGLSISRTVFSPTIGVTITNDSWGHTKTFFTGQCDPTTNLLHGFVGNSVVIVSFGALNAPTR